MRLASLPLMVGLCIGLGGCMFAKKPLAKVPAPVAPAGIPAPLPSAAPAPPEGAHPIPVLTPPEPQLPPPEPLPAISRTPPAQPTPSVPERRPAAATPPEPAPAVSEPPPVRLGAILSPERERQYQTDLNRSLTAAKAATSHAGTAPVLTPTQKETVARIQTFIEQAEGMAEQDIATAVQIARRAELLGQELSRTLR